MGRGADRGGDREKTAPLFLKSRPPAMEEDFVLVLDEPIDVSSPGSGVGEQCPAAAFPWWAVPHAAAERTNEVLFASRAYDADLGMSSEGEVQRQLDADVPRCDVWVDGAPTVSWEEVWASALYPRMCTQAVLAPVVEWFLRGGVILRESGAPMRVDVVSHDTVRVQKVLRVGGGGEGGSAVVIRIDAFREAVVIACELVG